MRYVVTKKGKDIEAFWCYYTRCDTCHDRFKCFTSSIIIDNCLSLTSGDVIAKLRSHGIEVDHLVEF